jgi:hypothetical protein
MLVSNTLVLLCGLASHATATFKYAEAFQVSYYHDQTCQSFAKTLIPLADGACYDLPVMTGIKLEALRDGCKRELYLPI